MKPNLPQETIGMKNRIRLLVYLLLTGIALSSVVSCVPEPVEPEPDVEENDDDKDKPTPPPAPAKPFTDCEGDNPIVERCKGIDYFRVHGDKYVSTWIDSAELAPAGDDNQLATINDLLIAKKPAYDINTAMANMIRTEKMIFAFEFHGWKKGEKTPPEGGKPFPLLVWLLEGKPNGLAQGYIKLSSAGVNTPTPLDENASDYQSKLDELGAYPGNRRAFPQSMYFIDATLTKNTETEEGGGDSWKLAASASQLSVPVESSTGLVLPITLKEVVIDADVTPTRGLAKLKGTMTGKIDKDAILTAVAAEVKKCTCIDQSQCSEKSKENKCAGTCLTAIKLCKGAQALKTLGDDVSFKVLLGKDGKSTEPVTLVGFWNDLK